MHPPAPSGMMAGRGGPRAHLQRQRVAHGLVEAHEVERRGAVHVHVGAVHEAQRRELRAKGLGGVRRGGVGGGRPCGGVDWARREVQAVLMKGNREGGGASQGVGVL
jgi:hypothetical protein